MAYFATNRTTPLLRTSNTSNNNTAKTRVPLFRHFFAATFAAAATGCAGVVAIGCSRCG